MLLNNLCIHESKWFGPSGVTSENETVLGQTAFGDVLQVNWVPCFIFVGAGRALAACWTAAISAKTNML